ncbi:fibronectin type III domain-containing protein [Aquimarina sp. AU474]|uniref:fibronectin type III domain-containing protein n=1 Tax=Aquimarina sp. AU474 TaxID=2108529 RepID=UPI001357FDEC|nr:fibronectin type III domain-containing protein [Aquimarina sp. AU474]
MIKRVLLVLCLLYCGVQQLTAQNFPVQINPIGSRPYPNNLSAFAASTSATNPLQLRLLLTDITTGNQRPINLRISVRGNGINVASNPAFIQNQQLTLDAGIPLTLGAIDLAPYFEFQNLLGISPDQYETPLRDGSYDFCFEVIDARSGVQISETKCVNLPVSQINPPFLTWPINESKITATDPSPQINFNWSPASGGNITGVKYKFRLVQIPLGTQDIQGFMLGTQGGNNCTFNNDDYSVICRDNIIGTSLPYNWNANPQDNPLLEDHIYAWQVQAYVDQDGEQISTFFENFGLSQVFWFRYQTPCIAPNNVETKQVGARTAAIGWDLESTHIDYIINYREKGGDSKWYPITTPRNATALSNLKPATRYEYKVAGNCDAENVAYGQVMEFETVTEDVAMYQGCGIEPNPYTVDPNSPNLDRIFPGFVIIAGDFPITVTKLEKNDSPFKGYGYAGIPWLGLPVVAVEFEGITVNSKLQLTSGVITTTYDPTFSNFPGFDPPDDPGDPGGGTDQDVTHNIPGIISSVDPNTDPGTRTITIYGDNGEVLDVVTMPEGDATVTLVDEEGNTWVVDSEGNVQTPTDGGPGSDNPDVPTDDLTAENIQVNFLPSGSYAFDQIPSRQTGNLLNNSSNSYVVIKEADSLTDYFIPHKAIQANKNDEIIATLRVTDESDLSNLTFKNENDVKIDATIGQGNTLVTLSLNGANSFKREMIKAVVSKDGKEKLAGQFTLWHLPRMTPVNITIVPVNLSEVPSKVAIQKELDNIFNPSSVKINITVSDRFFPESGLYRENVKIWDTDAVSPRYSYELRKFYIGELAKNRLIEQDQYYIFISDETPDMAVTGAMLTKNQFGFIFEDQITNSSAVGFKNNLGQIIGYHIGKGILDLQDATDLRVDKGSTQWLMDSGSTGVKLPHMHWDKIHKDFTPYNFPNPDQDALFDLPEEEQFASLNFGKNGNDTYTFLSPSLEGVILPPKAGRIEFFYGYNGRASQGDFKQFMDFIPGSLKSFAVGNQFFEADIERAGDVWVFKGYKSGDEYYKYEKYSIERDDVIWGSFEDSPIVLLHDKLIKLSTSEIDVLPYSYDTKNLKTVFDFQANVQAHNKREKLSSSQRVVVRNTVTPVTQGAVDWAFKNKNFGQGHLFAYYKIAELRTTFPHVLDENIRSESTYNKWHSVDESCKEKFGARGGLRSRFISQLLQKHCDCDIPITGPQVIATLVCEDKANPTSPKPETQYDYIIDFLRFIRDDIQGIIGDEVQGFYAKLSPPYSTETIYQYLENVSFEEMTPALTAGTKNDLKNLNSDIVIRILSRYADSFITQGGSYENDEELAVVRLMENIDVPQAKGVIQGLQRANIYDPEKILYKQLFDKVDDSFLGFFKNNRKAFINSLIRLCFLDREFYDEQLSKYFNDFERRNFVQQYRNIVRRLAEEGILFNDFILALEAQNLEENEEGFLKSQFGYLDIETDYKETTGTFDATQVLKQGISPGVPVSASVEGLTPFDLVRFSDKTSLSIIGDPKASIMNYPLPAIVLLYSDNKLFNRTVAQSINTTIDVASLTLTLGTASVATRAGRYALAWNISDDIASLTITGLSDQVNNPYVQQLSNALALKSLLQISHWGYDKITNIKVSEHALDPPKVQDVADDINRISTDSNELLRSIANDDRAYIAINYYLRRGKIEAIETNNSAVLSKINESLKILKKARNAAAALPVGIVVKGQAKFEYFKEITSIAGAFRAFSVKELRDGKRVIVREKRAGTFWRTQGENRQDIAQYTSKDGLFYIRHNQEKGELLFFDVTTKKAISWSKDRDEDKLFDKLLNKYAHLNNAEREVAAYEELIDNLKRINGYTNEKTIYLPDGNVSLSLDKNNVILGKWNPNSIPGISGEIGTDDILEKLTIFKNYSFADKSQELRKGGINMLNLPDEVIDYNTFFKEFNLPFLKFIKENKDKIRIIIVTDPRKKDVLRVFEDGVPTDKLTGFGKEIKYLIDNDIKEVHFRDGSIINLASLANLVDVGRRFTTTELALLKRADLPDFVANNLDDLLLAENRTAIWELTNVPSGQFKRGDLIEEIFNQWGNKYANYQNLNDIIPNYRTLDFDGVLANVNEVVSLKTFKPISNNTLGNFKTVLKNNVRKLNNDATIGENHSGKDRILDFTIENGFWRNNQLDDIDTYIDDLLNDFPNVADIRISEF